MWPAPSGSFGISRDRMIRRMLRNFSGEAVHHVQREDNPKNPPGLLPDPSRAELRRRVGHDVEALESEDMDGAWPAEARHVLHELRVHQIELDMQNAELRSAREQLEVSRARYFDLTTWRRWATSVFPKRG